METAPTTATEAWAEVWEQLGVLVRQLLFSIDGRLTPIFLLMTVAIVAVIYLVKRPNQSFRSFIFPAEIYNWAAMRVDFWMVVVNIALKSTRAFKVSATSALIAAWMQTLVPSSGAGGAANPVLVGLVLVAAADFTIYWVHRLHHETPLFWPLHSLHHSAEEMTPLTAFREHPAFLIIATFITGIAIGLIQGGVLLVLFEEISVYQIAGVNAVYVLSNIAASNLRHSHVWLRFGYVVEHIFISPAQHQIHHSTNPEHHDKNYGEILAIWDWMFGTLYVPPREEALEFGLSDSKGQRLPQRHGTLRAALWVPLADFVKGFAPRRSGGQSGRNDTPAE